MEAHPVPQNVTSFEFHLVGDMTLKQFGYLASGLGVAYLMFIILGNTIPLLVWPVSIVSSLLGIAFAFLPIAERPLDHWVGAYFKAIFLPTKRDWSNHSFDKNDPRFKTRLSVILSQLHLTQVQTQAQTVASYNVPPQSNTQKPSVTPTTARVSLQPENDQPKPQPVQQPQTPNSNLQAKTPAESLPSSQELHRTVELAKKASEIQTRIVTNEQELNMIKSAAAAPDADSGHFTEQFQEVLNNLQTLTSEASEVSRELATLSGSSQQSPQAKIVVPTIKRSAPLNLSLTSSPNVINGIVTDTQNNYLEGVIVVTHDKQGLPVRALKTNKLGQFVAATPLPNGTYTLSMEKDNLNFGSLVVELNGKILPPIVIAAERRIPQGG